MMNIGHTNYAVAGPHTCTSALLHRRSSGGCARACDSGAVFSQFTSKRTVEQFVEIREEQNRGKERVPLA